MTGACCLWRTDHVVFRQARKAAAQLLDHSVVLFHLPRELSRRQQFEVAAASSSIIRENGVKEQYGKLAIVDPSCSQPIFHLNIREAEVPC